MQRMPIKMFLGMPGTLMILYQTLCIAAVYYAMYHNFEAGFFSFVVCQLPCENKNTH